MSGVTHSHVSAIADDPTKDVSSGEWNDAHVIADGSFAAAKVAFSATDKLLGRATAGAGNGEEIALTAAGRALIAAVDAAAERAALGVLGDHTHNQTGNGADGGGNTLTPTWLYLPNGNPVTYSGLLNWNLGLKIVQVHNTQRNLDISGVGWAPSAFPLGFMQSGTYTTSLALAAVSGGNGGSVAVPILVSGHMLVQSISFYNGTGAGSCEARLFRQPLNNGNAAENSLLEVAGVNFASRTNSASAVNTVNITTPGTYAGPGLYWLVFRNTHASTVFALGSLAAGTLALSNAQTKAIAALGSTLDFHAATWTKINSVVGCRLNGIVFGEAAAF